MFINGVALKVVGDECGDEFVGCDCRSGDECSNYVKKMKLWEKIKEIEKP